ncbi:MAG: phage capsid protein [Pseudomonadota bacterium]
MSDPTASQWFTTTYEQGAIHVFQDRGGRIANRNCVRRKSVTDSKDAKFNITGSLTAYEKGTGRLKGQNTAKSNKIIAHKRYKVTPVIDEYDLDQMNADDVDESSKAAGMALGRKADDLIVEALNTSTTTPLGGTGTFMSPDLCQQAIEALQVNDVADDLEVWGLMSPRMWSHMMRFKEFTSADYMGPELAWKDMRKFYKTFSSVHWINFNRLPVPSGSLRRGFLWVRPAVGHVELGDIKTRITWENPEDHWFVNMHLTQGADILLPEGIIPFDVDESIASVAIDPEAYTAS